jgi:superfamily I DNA/RNA helicase
MSSPIIDKVSLIRGLNPAQRKGIIRSPSTIFCLLLCFIAVEHDPVIPLQILAGPGSGKTKVSSRKRAYTVPSYSDIQSSKGSYI